MSDQPVTEALQREYSMAFRMFRDAVNRLDNEQWGQGEPTWTEVPARTAMHTLLCAAYYIADTSDGFEWRPSGVQFWDAPIDQLPDRQATLAEIDRLADETEAYLVRNGDAGLLNQQAGTNPELTRVAWIIYALRHLQHHVAQISAECKRRRLGAAKWD